MTKNEAVALMSAGILEGAAGIWIDSRASVWFEVATIGQEMGWIGGMKLHEVDEQYSIGKFPYTDEAKTAVRDAANV